MNDSTGNAARLEEERFHDLIHSVNSDGLQSMAWPGRRKEVQKHTEVEKPDEDAPTRQTLQKDRIDSEKNVDELSKEQVEAEVGIKDSDTKIVGKGQKPKPRQLTSQKANGKRKENAVTDTFTIEGEWGDFKVRLSGYNSRDSNAMRYVILLPEKIHDIIQVVFNRDSSAAISVILQSFIDRNRGNMRDLITEKSTLF